MVPSGVKDNLTFQVLLRTTGWCMFIYSTFFTLKHYPEKGGFYYPFFSFYTLWFVSGPCIIIIANHIIAQWVREKVRHRQGPKPNSPCMLECQSARLPNLLPAWLLADLPTDLPA